MRLTLNRQRGQALVMVTLALLGMFGIIGLAVDLGWSFYVKKSAQAAADSAALAAVLETIRGAGTGKYTCGSPNVDCWTAPQPCPASSVDTPTSNTDNACLYARQNGFSTGGEGGTQSVTIQSGVPAPGCFPNCIPTAPGVRAYYWVTVRVSQQVPQLFSAVLGNPTGITSARATAAIADVVTLGSLILLNRKNDPAGIGSSVPPAGTDFYLGGNGRVNVPGGILLASTSRAAGDFGGQGRGQGYVSTPFTHIQGVNGEGGLPADVLPRWEHGYENKVDGVEFRDPFETKGQPPLTTQSLNPIPVPDGKLTCEVCPSGIYFATTLVNGKPFASGAPIQLPKANGKNPPTLKFDGGSFGEFTFFGGLVADNAGSKVDFGPGRYVMAGVNASVDGAKAVFETRNATKITGGGVSGAGTLADAGRLFILTDSTYPGLAQQIQSIDTYLAGQGGSRQWDYLHFGTSSFQSGNNEQSSVNLYGLDKSVTHSETNAQGFGLQDFGNIVIWQDQRNSNVKYNADGTYDWTSCGGQGHNIENLCTNTTADRSMNLSANQQTTIEGIVYQPRGANVTVWAGTGYQGPITLVSGAIYLQGTPDLTLTGPLQPLTRRVAALVE